jgi:hypothetical protein
MIADQTPGRVQSIHPAIDCALSVYPAPLAVLAADVIAGLFEHRRSTSAWGGSLLTGDGFPFELSFSSVDSRLRFTAEPGPRALRPDRRLGEALELAERLQGVPIESARRRALHDMQSGAPLRFGAWLGCRLASDGTVATKVYVEAPGEGPGVPLHLPDRTVARRLVGFSPATDEIETYVRVPSLEPRHLPAVFAAGGLPDHTNAFLDFFRSLYGFSVRGRLPGAGVGVSYTTGTSVPRLALHFRAHTVWGSDARIRTRFLQHTDAGHGHTRAYRIISSTVDQRPVRATAHGLLSLTCLDGRWSLALGLRPVPP